MKKYSAIIASLLLISCATDPMQETKDEFEIRKTETPEQTIIRQNKTIAAIKEQIKNKQTTQQIRLEIPDTCDDVNKQLVKFLEEMATIANFAKEYEAIMEKSSSQNMCTFCRSNNYSEFMKVSENMKEQLKSFMTTKYLGISLLKDNPNDNEKQYIQRISKLCIQNNQKEQFNFLENKFGNNSSNSQNSEEALKQFEKVIDETKAKCDEYNLDNLKKARQVIQKKYEFIKNNPLIATVEDECRHKFWGATSKQCSCYTRTYFAEIKKLELKVISEKEQCRVYHDDFAIFRVESNARKKCGL